MVDLVTERLDDLDVVPSKTLVRVWFGIGLQSFGGGVTTMTLIRRSVVDQHRWLTEERFNRDFALCQMTPGVNLLALTVLVGKQTAGIRGMIISLIGLLLPSVFLTVVITALFVSIKDLPAVKAVLRGVLPASVGLGMVTAILMAKTTVKASLQKSHFRIGFILILLVTSGVLVWTGAMSATLILIGGGILGAVEGAISARMSRNRTE